MQNALSQVRNEIKRLRRASPPVSYGRIAATLGINPATVWRLHNQPEYTPTLDTLHELGIMADPRTRHRVNVDAETHARIKAEAARRGVTMAEVVREALYRHTN